MFTSQDEQLVERADDVGVSDVETFEWNNIYYSIEGKSNGTSFTKHILNGITGHAFSGEIVAILGSSGAGKTTLLNVLAGRISRGKIEGTVTINGRRRPKNWVELIGYVEQEDLLPSHMSVAECIEFSGSLRLPRQTTRREVDEKVDQCLDELGLLDCAENMIGSALRRGISGGQRKRVSIGQEVIANSWVLFLDEPTTGLDAFNAQMLVETIKNLAIEENKIVLLTIHQPRPDVLMMFDSIILMTQGKVAFFGSLSEGLEYFSSIGFPCPSLMNPADYFIDLITVDTRNSVESQKRIDFILESWNDAKTLPAAVYDEQDSKPYKIPITWRPLASYQLGKLIQREWRGMIREMDIIFSLVLQTALLAFLVCIVYFQIKFSGNQGDLRNVSGALFLVGANIMFSTVIPLTTLFPLRREVLIRERYVRMYHPSLAYIATAITNLPIRIIGGVLFILISYWIVAFRAGCQYFMYTCVFVIALVFTSVGIGLTIGSLFPSVKIVQIFSPLILLIFLFFSGNTANSFSVSWIFRWIQYTSIVYWFFRGIMQIQFQGLVFAGGGSGAQVLALYGFNGVGPWFSLLMILSIGMLVYASGAAIIGQTYRMPTKVV